VDAIIAGIQALSDSICVYADCDLFMMAVVPTVTHLLRAEYGSYLGAQAEVGMNNRGDQECS